MIEKLHAEREQLLHTAPHSAPQIRRLDFSHSVFDEKKLIAAEFIERIELDGNHVNIIGRPDGAAQLRALHRALS